MRHHHEELTVAPSIVPALSLLIPFAGALWARIKSTRKKDTHPSEASTRGGDL